MMPLTATCRPYLPVIYLLSPSSVSTATYWHIDSRRFFIFLTSNWRSVVGIVYFSMLQRKLITKTDRGISQSGNPRNWHECIWYNSSSVQKTDSPWRSLRSFPRKHAHEKENAEVLLLTTAYRIRLSSSTLANSITSCCWKLSKLFHPKDLVRLVVAKMSSAPLSRQSTWKGHTNGLVWCLHVIENVLQCGWWFGRGRIILGWNLIDNLD